MLNRVPLHRVPWRESDLSIEALRARRGIVEQRGPTHQCFGPASGNSDAQTTTNDNRVGAADAAQVATGSAITAKDEAIVQTGTNNNFGGLTISGGSGTVTLQSVDPDVVKKALETVEGLTSSTLAATQESQDKTNALLTSLAESKQTEGGSTTQKNLVALGVGALAAIVAVSFVAKK